MNPITHQLQHRLGAALVIVAVALCPSVFEILQSPNRSWLFVYVVFLVYLAWQFTHIFTEADINGEPTR